MKVNSTFNSAYLLCTILYSEIFFHALVYRTFSLSLFTVLFSVISGLLIYLILRLLPSRHRFRTTIVLLVLMWIVYVSQFLYYSLFKQLYTIYSLTNGAQVAEFWRDILNLILRNSFWILIFSVPLLIYLLINQLLAKVRPAKPTRRLLSLTLLIPATVIWLLTTNAISARTEGTPSIQALYQFENEPLLAAKNFGLLTAMRLDLYHMLMPPEADLSTPPVQIPVVTTTTPSKPEHVDTAETQPSVSPTPVPEPQILNIDFDRLIAETNDPTLEGMHKYFQNIRPTTTNPYSGRYKDYNLIFITAEAYSRFSPDPVLTPTLWKLQEEGMKFTNFYNPVWGVSTLDGEYVGLTGLIPKSGVWSLFRSSTNDMRFSYGNRLREFGYQTQAYHNHTYTYYNRDQSHPNLGYDYMGVGNGLNIKPTWPGSDIELMTETMDRYMDQPKFHTYYLTVSGHMGYRFIDNAMATKNRDLVADLPYHTEEAKGYMATQIEFDRAMELLLSTLKAKGIADKTLIVVNADHYPYGLPQESIDELAGEKVDPVFEIYRGSLLLYVDGMKPETIDKVSYSVDVLPTIYNLLGIPYDSRLFAGRDIFSDEPGLAIFKDRSWISDQGRFNAAKAQFTPNPGVTVSSDYVEQMNRLVEQRFQYSRLILEEDYYRCLD